MKKMFTPALALMAALGALAAGAASMVGIAQPIAQPKKHRNHPQSSRGGHGRRKSTLWIRHMNSERECARRRRQIAAGRLRVTKFD